MVSLDRSWRRHGSALHACEALEGRVLLAASELVADLTPATFGSAPREFASGGGVAYFLAKGAGAAASAVSLWKTDGTPAGTQLVKETLEVNRISPPLTPRSLMVSPSLGRLFFVGSDAAHGIEPWVSDGTDAGTKLLKDVSPAGWGMLGSESGFVEFRGRVYFAAAEAGGNLELWVTDGTEDGTQPFADLRPGPAGSAPAYLTVAGDYLYFQARDDSGYGLWRTDGKPEGTIKLHGFASSTAFHSFTAAGDTLLFGGTAPDTGWELWKSDGTPEGTTLLKDIYPGPDPSYVIGLVPVGDEVYFEASSPTGPNGARMGGLWKSDGTAEGTVLVLDRPPGFDTDLAASPIIGLNDHIAMFFAQDPVAGNELWRSDGTAEGTYRVKDIWPGPNRGVDPRLRGWGLHAAGGHVFFIGSDGGPTGVEFWASDGTAEGTVQLGDFIPGSGWGADNSLVYFPVEVNGKLLFAPNEALNQAEPYVSDGTAAGTRRLVDINPTPFQSAFDGPVMPVPQAAASGLVLFHANGQLFRSDGTAAGTTALADLSPKRFGAIAAPWSRSFGVVNGVAVFADRPSSTTVNMWLYRSDGTREGTYRLTPPGRNLILNDGSAYFPETASAFVTAGGYVYFAATDGGAMRLWRTDGTVAGTSAVREPAGASYGTFPIAAQPKLAAVGGTVFFVGFGNTLWKTDGTQAGTVMVSDGGGSGLPGIDRLSGAGGRLFFTVTPTGLAPRLWVSDGAAAGTHEVPGTVVVTTSAAAVDFNGVAYVQGLQAGGPTRLFRSDGTAEGTYALGPDGLLPSAMTVMGDRLYFFASGRGLWATDGTPQGTALVADPPLTAASSLTAVGDALYFSAADAEHGRELWTSDGTAAGTALVEDLMPGSAGSSPDKLTNLGGVLYYVAADPVHGNELRRYVPPPAPPAIVQAVFVSATGWSDVFKSQVAALGAGSVGDGYAVSGDAERGPLRPLPWVGIDRLALRFGSDVRLAEGDLAVRGVAVDWYGFNASGATPAFEYEAATRTGRWTLERRVGGDRLALSPRNASFDPGGGAAGVGFPLRINVLPGDVDGSGVVNALDVAHVKRRLGARPGDGRADASAYGVFADVTGDGGIDALDLAAVKQRLMTRLPADLQVPVGPWAPAALLLMALATADLRVSRSVLE